MSLPTLEECRQGATTWKRDHLGVSYTLSHHGVSSYSPQGTWCFYIHLHDNLFIGDDFKLFDRQAQLKETSPGLFYETYDYWDVPDYGFHGGITWYSKERFVDRDGIERTSLKIGCDYAHLWDREGGYSDGLNDVDWDAKKLIAELVKNHPVKWRCSYCGKLDIPENFYIAKNDARVHVSQEDKFSELEWPMWMRKQEVAA